MQLREIDSDFWPFIFGKPFVRDRKGGCQRGSRWEYELAVGLFDSQATID